MQLDLPRAIALRRPNKLAAVFPPDRHWLRIEIEPDRVLFSQQLAGRAGDGIDREQDFFLLRPILDEEAERGCRFLPNDAREVGILLAIPVHPPCRSARSCDYSEADPGVVRAGARIEIFRRRRFGMQGIRDETAFDATVVRFLVSDPLRIRRPPESLVPFHFLLGGKFRHAVLKRFRGAGGQGDIVFRFKIDDVEFTASNGGNRAAIGREMRIDPALARKFGHARIRPRDDVQLARERDEQFAAVFRQVKAGKTAQTLAGALPPAPFLRREFLVGALEQFLRREDFPQFRVGNGEFVKPKDRIARAAAQKNHCFPVRRKFRGNGLP